MFYLKYVILEFAKNMPEERERKPWIAWEKVLQESGIEVRFSRDAAEFGEKHAEGKNHEGGTLWITDESMRARAYVNEGRAVLGLLTEENGGRGFDGVPFLASDLPETEPEYLDRVYRRQAGIPWDVLETERCILRETAHGDADAFYEIYGEPSITEYMEGLPKDREAFHAWLEDYGKHVYGLLGYGIWTVCRKNGTGDPFVIGRAGLSVREGFDEPELGFVIGKTWQGQALALEVCTAILEYAGKLEIPEVISFAEKGNTAAKGLLLKLGFQEAGEAVLDARECVRFSRRREVLQA